MLAFASLRQVTPTGALRTVIIRSLYNQSTGFRTQYSTVFDSSVAGDPVKGSASCMREGISLMISLLHTVRLRNTALVALTRQER